jgi:hypothetical protein
LLNLIILIILGEEYKLDKLWLLNLNSEIVTMNMVSFRPLLFRCHCYKRELIYLLSSRIDHKPRIELSSSINVEIVSSV